MECMQHTLVGLQDSPCDSLPQHPCLHLWPSTARISACLRPPNAGVGYQCSLHKLVAPKGLQPAEWNQTECNQTATYRGLASGSYEFRVLVSGSI